MNPGLTHRYGVSWKTTTANAVISSTCQKSIHQSGSCMTRTIEKQSHHANDYQCHDCRAILSNQILCYKCGKGLETHPQQVKLRSQRGHSASRMHSSEPHRERTSETRLAIVELLQPADKNDHAELCPTVSTPPASSVELCDTRHSPEPIHLQLFCLPQSVQGVKSESNLYYVLSIP